MLAPPQRSFLRELLGEMQLCVADAVDDDLGNGAASMKRLRQLCRRDEERTSVVTPNLDVRDGWRLRLRLDSGGRAFLLRRRSRPARGRR